MKFYFKGNRNYIHSSDIITFLEKKFPKIKNLKIFFRSKLSSQPIFRLSDEKNHSKDNFNGEFYLEDKIYYFSFSNTLNKDIKNYPYDEESIFQKVKFNQDNYVEFFEESKYNNIDILISMAKYLSIQKFKSKSWSVVKINLKQGINHLQYKYKEIKIALVKNRLIKYDVICDKKNLGEIYFYNLK